MLRTRHVTALGVLAVAGLLSFGAFAGTALSEEDGPSVLDLSSAEQYVKQFEFDAAAAEGKPFTIGYPGKEAMRRVKDLMTRFPENPKVKDLYERVRACVMKSRGQVFEITKEMLAYRELERLVAETLGKEAEKAWATYRDELRASPRYLPEPFPAPEPGTARNEESMFFRKVVLKGFAYPANEFTTSGKQYCFVGGPVQGFYFVELSNRRWLGAYEALRRYRREANGHLPEEWVITGTITGSDILVPHTGEKKASDVARFGWIVKPDSIYVPGLVFAKAEPGHPKGGSFVGEDRLSGLKAPFLTYTELPAKVEPKELVEVYAAAVKEKNYDLFLECLDPDLKDTPLALEDLRQFWDVNQRGFATDFVHVEAFEVGEPTVIRGERLSDEDPETFFLDEEDKDEIRKRADDLIEEVHVTIRRFDEKGKQVGTPRDLILRRYKGSRWFIREGLVF